MDPFETGMLQQQTICRCGTEQDGHAIGGDPCEQRIRREAFDERCARANPKWKNEQAAETEGEGERRVTSTHVVGRRPENVACIAVGRRENIGRGVRCAFRRSCTAGRIRNQRNIAAGDRRVHQAALVALSI